MKILYMTSVVPSKKGAGSSIDDGIIQYLVKKGHLVDAIIMRSDKDKNEIPGYLHSVWVYELNTIKRIINGLLFFYLPGMLIYRFNLSIVKKIYELKDVNYDCVFFSFSQSSLYMHWIKKYWGTCRKVVLLHDVLRQSFQRKVKVKRIGLSNIYNFIEYSKFCIFERKFYSPADTILVLNNKDKQILNEDGLDSQVITPIYKQYNYNPIKDEKFNICFFGSFNRFENVDAVKYFLSTVHSKLKYLISDYNFIILGNEAEKHFISDSNITVYGFQDDPSNILNTCKMSVVMLRYGAGIKIKILELLAMGIPCVCTEVGSEGILPNMGLFTCDTPDDVVSKIYKLYQEKIYNDKDMIRKSFLNLYDLKLNDTVFDEIFSGVVFKQSSS